LYTPRELLANHALPQQQPPGNSRVEGSAVRGYVPCDSLRWVGAAAGTARSDRFADRGGCSFGCPGPLVSTPLRPLNEGGDPLASTSFRNPARASDRRFGN